MTDEQDDLVNEIAPGSATEIAVYHVLHKIDDDQYEALIAAAVVSLDGAPGRGRGPPRLPTRPRPPPRPATSRRLAVRQGHRSEHGRPTPQLRWLRSRHTGLLSETIIASERVSTKAGQFRSCCAVATPDRTPSPTTSRCCARPWRSYPTPDAGPGQDVLFCIDGAGGTHEMIVWLTRPAYLPPDPASRTSYEPGEIAQCDLWFPPMTLPVGFGQTRTPTQLPVLTMVTGYSRCFPGC